VAPAAAPLTALPPAADEPQPAAPVPDFPETVGLSEQLTATRLAPDVYVLQWRRWAANVLVVKTLSGEVILVDSPGTTRSTRLALDWIERSFGRLPAAAFTSHFHLDGSGGNAELKRRGVPIYASDLTRDTLARDGRELVQGTARFVADDPEVAQDVLATEIVLPDRVFEATKGVSVVIGGEPVEVRHLHGAHTRDHVAVFFPRRKLVYGGCAVRHVDSLGKRFDGVDYAGWQQAMQELLAWNPEYVIPGHGSDYTRAGIERTLLLTETALATQAMVSAAGGGGASLEASGSYKVEPTTLTVGEQELSLHLPRGKRPPLASVLVFHSALGRTASVLEWSNELARAGFAAVVYDFYRGKTATHGAEAAALRAEASARAGASKRHIEQVYAALREDPRLASSQRFLLGWSFGAAWATYALDFLPQLSGVVAYYGQSFTDNTQLFAKTEAPVLLIGGERDTEPPPERLKQIAEQLRAKGKSVDLLLVPAGHGFAEGAHPGYDAAASEKAWERVLSFLRAHSANASPRARTP
jgi:dienelactone hydrolase/glyoxylase-like metal-dependent hydrolase (beta-lactamase superfamily II)